MIIRTNLLPASTRIAKFCLIALIGLQTSHSLAEEFMSAPKAKKQPYTMTTHGDVRVDDYYWLRDDKRKSPDVIDYLEKENAYSQQQLAQGEGLKKQIYEELLSRMKADDESVPYNYNGYTYRSRFEAGNNYPIYERRPVNSHEPWQVLVDGNQRAEGSEYYRLGTLTVSPDNKHIAIAEDREGRNNYSISFRSLDSQEWQNAELTNTSGNIVWANDNNTLFYVNKDPQTLLPYQVFYHQVGTQQQQDVMVYEEKMILFMSACLNRHQKIIFLLVSQVPRLLSIVYSMQISHVNKLKSFKHVKQGLSITQIISVISFTYALIIRIHYLACTQQSTLVTIGILWLPLAMTLT